MTIPPQRFHAALVRLVEIQLRPAKFSQHRLWAWEALESLAPELSLLGSDEAREWLNNKTDL